MPGTMNMPNINFGAVSEDMTKLTGGWLPGQDIQKQFLDAYRQIYGGYDPTAGLTPDQQAAYDAAMKSGGGFDPAQVAGFYNSTLNGQGRPGFIDPSTAGYRQLAGTAGGPMGLDYAERAARGEFVGKNPYLEDTFDNASRGVSRQFSDATMPSIEGRMSMAGRLGSNAEMNLGQNAREDLGDTLDRLATGIYGGAYDADMARMSQAGLSLPGMYATDAQRRAGVLDAQSNAARSGYAINAQNAQQDWANKMAAASGYGGAMSAAMAPEMAKFGLASQAANPALTNWSQMVNAYNTEFGRPQGPGGYNGVAPHLGAGASDGGGGWGDVAMGVAGLGMQAAANYYLPGSGAVLGNAWNNWMATPSTSGTGNTGWQK